MALILGIVAALVLVGVGIAFGRELERWEARREAEADIKGLQALSRIHYFS